MIIDTPLNRIKKIVEAQKRQRKTIEVKQPILPPQRDVPDNTKRGQPSTTT